jgi:hypothetical protein
MGHWHSPLTQTKPDLHTFPQRPQLEISESRLEFGHWHSLSTQTEPGLHAFPQCPQLEKSESRLMHGPKGLSQSVCPAEATPEHEVLVCSTKLGQESPGKAANLRAGFGLMELVQAEP